MKKIFRDLSLSSDSSFVIKEEMAAQFAAPFHFHHGYEFTYIVRGYGKFYGGDHVLNFQSGDIFLFGIGFPHYFINDQSFIETGELAHSIIIQFSADFLGSDFFLKSEFKAVKELLKKSNRGLKFEYQTGKLQRQILELKKTTGLKALINILQLLEVVSSQPKDKVSIISSATYKSPVRTSNNEDRLDEVFKYVLEKFKDEISSKQAASLACMNEAAFCRFFKRRTNKTFSQFTNNVRITHATFLLAEKILSVSQVCFECGFDNLSYFNRQFKSIMGSTPLSYRKSFNQLNE